MDRLYLICSIRFRDGVMHLLQKLELSRQKWLQNGLIDNHIQIDDAYCSTSERASDTLEIVTHHNMPYTRLKGLKEMNFGVFEGKDECLNPPFLI